MKSNKEMPKELSQSFEMHHTIQEEDMLNIIVQPYQRKTHISEEQSKEFGKEFKKKMLIYKFYNSVSIGVSTASTIV